MAPLRSVSDAALLRVNHATPPGIVPLARMHSPSSHGSFAGWAEQAHVEGELQGVLLRQKVDATRRKLHRQAQAVRDYEAGRSPPVSVKSAMARAALISDSFGKSPTTAAEHARDLVARPMAPSPSGPALNALPAHLGSPLGRAGASPRIGGSPRVTPFSPLRPPELRLAASGHASPTPGEGEEVRSGGAVSAGGTGGALQCATAPRLLPRGGVGGASPSSPTASALGGGPHTCACGGGVGRIASPAAPSSSSSFRKPARRGTTHGAMPNSRSAPHLLADAEAEAPLAASNGSVHRFGEPEYMAAYDDRPAILPAELLRVPRRTRAAAPPVARQSHQVFTRLEVVEGVSDTRAMRDKARASLLTSETLKHRTADQRKESGHGKDSGPSLLAHYAERHSDGGNGGRLHRQSSGSQQGGGGTSSRRDERAVAPVARMPNGEPAVHAATAHNSALSAMHSCTMQMHSSCAGKESSSGAAGGKESKEEARRGGRGSPTRAIEDAESFRGRAAAQCAQPGKNVGFAADAAGETSETSSPHRKSILGSRRGGLATMYDLDASGPVWQVAQPEGQPIEVDTMMMHKLPRDALVWTDGLHDWLPLGDVPHDVDELPPLPRGASPDMTHTSAAAPASPARVPKTKVRSRAVARSDREKRYSGER